MKNTRSWDAVCFFISFLIVNSLFIPGVASAITVGDFVWNDLSQDGLQQSSEPGLDGVIVQLQLPDGTTIDSTTTDATGHYLFQVINPGDYILKFHLLDGFEFSPERVGLDSAIDSDAGVLDGLTDPFTLLRTDDLSMDAGMFSPVPIPPAVWLFGSGLIGLIGIARRRKS